MEVGTVGSPAAPGALVPIGAKLVSAPAREAILDASPKCEIVRSG
jgi:hypothetical protein